jgi:hypothetical protein
MKHCFQCKGPFGLTRRKFASQQFCSNRCVDQYKSDVRGANELVNLVRKLRWARMEGEAKGIETALARGRATATDSVLATPLETD